MSDGERPRPSGNWLSRALRRVIPGAGRQAPAPAPEASVTAEQDDQREAPPSAAAEAAAPATVWEPQNDQTAAVDAEQPDGQSQSDDHTAAVVDPLERARAALADARRQMPGMLGEAIDEPPLPATVEAPEPPARIDEAGILAEVRALIATLQEERQRFAEEVEELRGVVGELRGEVQRLSATSQAPPQEPLAAADAAAEVGVPLAIAPGAEEMPQAPASAAEPAVVEEDADVAGAIHPLAIAPGAEELPAESQLPQERPTGDERSEVPAQVAAAGLRWHPGERGDFGFWVRPEALDLLEESAFVEMGSESADLATRRGEEDAESAFHAEGSAESEVAESAAAAQAGAARSEDPATADAVRDSAAESVLPSEAQTDPASALADAEPAPPVTEPYQVEFSPGERPLGLSVGPLHGVRRLSALEHRLAGCPGVGRVELASYRGGEASFRVTLNSPASLEKVIGALQGQDLTVSAYSVDPERGALRVRLAESGTDGRA